MAPAPAPSAHPSNLPVSLTSFVGRERELADVRALLTEARLVTVTGAGGAGKTRLALHAAAAVAGRYGGVWWVELASLAEAELVPQTVATALGVRERPGEDLLETLARAVASGPALLLLDNCEHLIDACAALVQGLLRSCPELAVLATSREPLGLAGEIVWRVPPLSPSDAARLFAQRARAAGADLAAAEQDGLVSRICEQLDGMPLAIELAAARARVLSLHQIATRLDEAFGPPGGRFRLLTDANRSAAPRHQTLRATVDWSYRLLGEDERRIFDSLSVFAGGFTLEAAESLCGGIAAGDVLDRLTSLVDRSLLVVDTCAASARYRLLETLRQYGAERLAASGGEDECRRRHAVHYLALAELGETELTGPRQVEWFQRLALEHDNLRSALRWSLERGEPETALRLCSALARFWWLRGYFGEGRDWFQRALSLAEPSGSLSDRGRLARAGAFYGAAVLARAQGAEQDARRLYTRAMALRRELGDRRGLAHALESYASLLIWQGNDAAAAPLLEESLALWRELGDGWGTGVTLRTLGQLALFRGDLELASQRFEEAVALLRGAQDRSGVAIGLLFHAPVAIERGNHRLAGVLLRECLAILTEIGEMSFLPWLLETCAGVAAARGHARRALQLAGAAAARRQMTGGPLLPAFRVQLERWLAPSRQLLGEAAAAAAWAAGSRLTADQATDLALGDAADDPPASPADVLTPREREVVDLVASGLTNRQVAQALIISDRTAERHVANILAKLELRSRAQLAVWAVTQRLGPAGHVEVGARRDT